MLFFKTILFGNVLKSNWVVIYGMVHSFWFLAPLKNMQNASCCSCLRVAPIFIIFLLFVFHFIVLILDLCDIVTPFVFSVSVLWHFSIPFSWFFYHLLPFVAPCWIEDENMQARKLKLQHFGEIENFVKSYRPIPLCTCSANLYVQQLEVQRV